ncbi:MAG: endolytic transglycosylase MltG, partial [Gammaproteobacteria bacterium]|nr:endolytic transglycosylase MltG [Gammaproteobacteria bacterium]
MTETARPRMHGRARLGALLAGALLLLVLVAAGAWLWLEHEFHAPGPSAAAVRLEVEPGTSVRTVLGRLQASGTVGNAHAVLWYLRVHGIRPRMQSGAYELPAHSSPAQILALFEEGKVILEQV